LESQGIKLALSDKADLDRFVSGANAKARIKGLDDALNPGIIDAAKLRAMVATLAMQPEPVRAALSGHELIVGTDGFGVLAVEPTRPDAFGPAYRITIERMAGPHVLANANPAMDKTLGRSQTQAAAAATAGAAETVKTMEAGKPDPHGLDLGDARWRRAQAARGWVIAARGWREADPGDAAASAALEEARKAMKAYDMPSGGRI
jgi:hypothetical protein